MNWINKARRAKGYTIDQMTREMNMSRGGYTKLEYSTNKLTLARFIQICKVLELDVTAAIKEVLKDENY